MKRKNWGLDEEGRKMTEKLANEAEVVAISATAAKCLRSSMKKKKKIM